MRDRFLADVIAGLSGPEKSLPCKYFYDERGARLFEQICELEEYYLTRVELSILRRHVGEMAELIGSCATIVEFGTGAGLKTRILLQALHQPQGYVPVDISGEQLHEVAAELEELCPTLHVTPLHADFTQPFQLPASLQAEQQGPTTVFFPGSTIGNFGPDTATRLMRQMADLCGPGGGVLIGFDLHKHTEVLERAYNDGQGVTAAFNLNLLERINRELDGDFLVDRFRHVAQYNANLRRMELSLESVRTQEVSVAGNQFEFAEGESIHTEYSYKYSLDDFLGLAENAGLRHLAYWTDDAQFFAIGKFRAS
ncbi:MAG: L-histidine N(alpha)-methyltransferase [Planctomycetales bacterium]|nr:L-histidine N(alpha)-methyltransferase [Planctomycetales bacterium]